MSAAAWTRPSLRRSGRALAIAPLAAVVAGGLALTLAAAGTHGFLVPLEHRGIRSWIDGPLGPLGFSEGPRAFGLEVALMAVSYLALLLVAERLDRRALIGSMVLLYALFAAAPPLLSTDVFSYISYARLGTVHGLDPYAFPPAAAPHDALFRFVHWRATRSPYGPLFTVASYPLGALAPAAALWTLKVVAGAAGLACVGLVSRIAIVLGRSPQFAAVAFGLNPLVLVWAVGGAHNDLLMLAVLLAGVLLVLERRSFAGGATLVLALAIKATAGLALPFALIGDSSRRRIAAGAALAVAGVALASYLAFGAHALNLIGILRRESRFLSPESVPHEIVRLFGLYVTGIVPRLLTAVLAGSLAWLALRVRRGSEWTGAVGWAFVAFIVTSTWFVPWYAIWPLPFAAVTRERRLLAAVLILQVDIVATDLFLFVR